MAIWQFDCYIIPKKNVLTNVCMDSDEILTWGTQSALIEKIEFFRKTKKVGLQKYHNMEK